MIRLILKVTDADKGTPGEVCEVIQQAIEAVEGTADGFRFQVEEAEAMEVLK
jgi:hypothetical protein